MLTMCMWSCQPWLIVCTGSTCCSFDQRGSLGQKLGVADVIGWAVRNLSSLTTVECMVTSGSCTALVRALRAHPGNLRSLSGVDLSKCDAALPLELLVASNTTILDHYRDLLRAGEVVSRRCRMMLLGNGGVGKTTLARRLVTGAPPSPDPEVTHGVAQRKSLGVLALLFPTNSRVCVFHVCMGCHACR
jgi:hypothetical protein